MRTPAIRKQKPSKLQSFPAPVGGWIANENLATPGARRPDGSKVSGAAILENWFPTATGIRMRAGSARYAKLGDGSQDVVSIFSYVNGNNRRLFGSTSDAIYDMTTVLYSDDQFLVDGNGDFVVDDDGNFVILEASPDPEVDTLGGGDWSVVQFATSGGVFLRAVNGVDTPLVYDGTTWSTTSAITGAVDTTLSIVWVFKNRLFFIQKDTLDAWYLPVDAIGGAAVKFPLGGVFTRGGSLMFGSSWSLDENSGLSASCAFFSTEGEVAVYKGTDPADADTWSLVGVYRIGKPRGPKAFIRAGGDLVIATDIGFVPLSQAIQRDVAALAPSAVSYPIEVAWNEAVADREDLTWQCEVWPTKQMVVVALPTGDGDEPTCFVANARTGAWAPFTGWQALCLEVFGDRLFWGSANGRVIEGEVGGTDQGQTYTAVVAPLFDPLKSPASLKSGLLARAVLRAPAAVEARLTLQADYNINLPSPPDDIGSASSGVWGAGIWGESQWGGAATKTTYQDWQSVQGQGYSLTVSTQITSGSLSPPDVEMVQTDLTYEVGDIVT